MGLRSSGGRTVWPSRITDWEYWDGDNWQPDPLLTVTGNIYIEISAKILTIFTEEGGPGYPESISLVDDTGGRPELAGVYRRQGEDRLWKYRDFQLSFNGEYSVNTFYIKSIISILKEISGASLETMASVLLLQDGTTLRIISGLTQTPFISSV